MPSTIDPVELLEPPEGRTLEFKRELSTPGGARGTLLIGVGYWNGHGRGAAEMGAVLGHHARVPQIFAGTDEIQIWQIARILLGRSWARSPEGRAQAGRTSSTAADPMPPPAHIETTPMPPPRRASSCTIVTTLRAPVHATG